MGKKEPTYNIIKHFPQTEEGKQELARRVAIVYADSIIERLRKLECPSEQKLQLLDAIVEDARKEAKFKKHHEHER